MEWISVEDRLPDIRKAMLGYCVSNDEDMEWCGIIQVYFSPNTGWKRCELYDEKPVHVLYWAEPPEAPRI